jgi:hypothetical protein
MQMVASSFGTVLPSHGAQEPVNDTSCAGQTVHPVCVEFGLDPAGQRTQLVAPAIQTLVMNCESHCAHSLWPASEYRPGGHSVHVSFCCVMARYLPAVQ